MQNNSAVTNIIYISPKFLWFLTLSYTVSVVLASWFDSVQIGLFEIHMSGSTIIFPITFQILNIITEVYGYKHARRAIWCGFLFMVIYIIFGQAIRHMPNPDYQTNNTIYDTLLTTHFNSMISLIIFYFASESINSYLVAKSKIITQGHYLFLRMVLSTSFAICIGCSIQSFSVFFREINLISLSGILVMLLITVACSPLSVYLSKKIKKIEKLDIYDERTSFSIFNFETEYTTKNNNISTDTFANGKNLL
jgi:uncharacterized integral membrane protein (TIGR00697 family)